MKISHWGWSFFGFLIGFSPFIIFELRHHFYNLRTIFLVLKLGTNKVINSFDFYYLLFLTPFFASLFAIFFSKLLSINKILGFFLIFLYLSWAMIQIYNFRFQPLGLPKGWNYLGQKK